jgi:hypothetical protein
LLVLGQFPSHLEKEVDVSRAALSRSKTIAYADTRRKLTKLQYASEHRSNFTWHAGHH